MATLPYLLWLTGREGLRPETAAALLRRFGTAEAVYFADEKEFELLQLPGRLCRSLADKSLEEQLALLHQDIAAFAAGAEQADDITMLLLRINETDGRNENG